MSLDAATQSAIDAAVEQAVAARFGQLEARLDGIANQLARAEGRGSSEKVSLLVFSGDMDRLLSAFIVATGATAMGLEVTMYFSFWGLVALRKQVLTEGKGIKERMFDMMLPGNIQGVGLSKLEMFGAGSAMMRAVMAEKQIETLPNLFATARELGVKMIACEMSMHCMGIRREELIEGIDFGGVATYIEDAADAKITLYI